MNEKRTKSFRKRVGVKNEDERMTTSSRADAWNRFYYPVGCCLYRQPSVVITMILVVDFSQFFSSSVVSVFEKVHCNGLSPMAFTETGRLALA